MLLVESRGLAWLRRLWHRWWELPLAAGDLAEAHASMAVQVREQTAVLHEQAQRADYLLLAGAELGRTLDYDESLQTAAEALYGLGRLSYVVVMTGRGELGPYTAAAVRGMSPEAAGRVLGHTYAVPLWGVMARALVSRQPVVIDDAKGESRPLADEFNWDVGGGSMLLFPVCGANGPFACVIAGSTEADRFAAGQDGGIVWALARMAAQSIQNARLYQEAVRSQEQLLTLQVISRLVASNAQIETVLDVLMREATEIMGEGHAWLYLKDDSRGGGSALYSRSHTPASAWGSVHQSAVAWVLQAGQPIFYDPLAPLAQSPILVNSGPAMCVPLETGDETLGALVIQSSGAPRCFAEDDMIVLRTLANAAAGALHNRQVAQRFETGYLELARSWARQADLRVWGRPGHGERVAANALTLAAALKLPADLLHPLQVAGLLHDVAAESSAQDWPVSDGAEDRGHAAEGAAWLAQTGLDARIAMLVRYHHAARPERVIQDADLGRAAGTLALVHALDAWLLGDGDHPPLALPELRQRLASDHAGGNFSPIIIEECLKLLYRGQLVVP